MGNIDFYKEMFITRIYYDIRYDVIKTFFQFDIDQWESFFSLL